MASFEDMAALSALPIVNLKEIARPKDGLFLPLGSACRKNFLKGDLCHQHYARLACNDLSQPTLSQCPFGFASVPFAAGHLKCAITAFVPFPRLGGDQERDRAKQNPQAKIPQENVIAVLVGLIRTYEKLQTLHDETIKNESMALHEIRKLNGTIKRTAERLYNTHHTGELLQIWKTSELMSKQFDVIEILANESLAQLAPNTNSEIYKIFDKCVHIYQPTEERITLWCQQGYYPRAVVSDKTFPIIPTVLIENALKYSPPGSGIGITFEKDGDLCLIKVANVVTDGAKLDSTVFKRGVRGREDTEGSGNGLYVAQLIAKQHGTVIAIEVKMDSTGLSRCVFSLRIKTL